MLNSKNRVFNPYFSIGACPMRKWLSWMKMAFVDKSRVERLFLAMPQGFLRFVIVVFPDHTHLLFLNLLSFSFSLKLFTGHFYGQFFIKTVRGPL